MPLPTPFHPRTSLLCETNDWRTWAGYMAPTTYQHAWEREYWAFRNSAGLLDISPLFKYDITGPDAARLLNRVMTRDLRKCQVGQVIYSPWCDETGDMIHDGNLVRMGADHFRLTAADPTLRWLEDCGYGMDVAIRDRSDDLCGLALQGPNSRVILQKIVSQTGAQFPPIDQLGYFQMTCGRVGSANVMITRTGYTGDLGYELWADVADALGLWDEIMAVGEDYGILPAGLAALDMVRVEAGLVLIEVDYISAIRAVIDGQKSSPLEAGMAWAVKFNKGDFVGRSALLKQQQAPEWQLVGLEISWETLEELWGTVNLRPTVVSRGTSRLPVPVYHNGGQVGQATSHLYSPLLKKYLALATLKTEAAAFGSTVEMEMTVEYSRMLAKAKIVPLPFFNPERKRK